MIANHLICQPAPLDRDRKFAIVGGGKSHDVKKSASLCFLSICFFGCFEGIKKLGLPPIKTLGVKLLNWTP
jgi:hypothetical protein